MTYRGKVKNGIVILDKPGMLPDGAVVSVRPLAAARPKAKSAKKPKSLYEHYKHCIGIVKGMPDDFSINHDHYLYGAPKRK